MKRKVVMKLLCITIVSAMLVSNAGTVLAAGIQRQAICEGTEITVTLEDDGTVHYFDAAGVEQIVPYEDFLKAGWQILEPQPENPGEGATDPENPGEGTTDPENPGEGTTDPENPGEGTTDPENPGEGTTDPENPGEGTTDPENPGEGTTDPENPGEGTTDPENPGEGTTDPENPGEGTTDPENPGEGTTDPENPGEEVTDPENPGEGVTDPENPESESTEATEGTAEEPAGPEGGETADPGALAEPAAPEQPLILATPAVTAGISFYIEELEEKYHLSFDEEFADVVDEIEDAFIAKVKAEAAGETTELAKPDVRYLRMMSELAKGDEKAEAEMEVLVEEAVESEPAAELRKDDAENEEAGALVLPEMGEEDLAALSVEGADILQTEDAAEKVELKKPKKEAEFRNWQDVLAVYLMEEHRQGTESYTMDASDKDGLEAVFNQMNAGAMEDGKIVVTSKTAADYETENEASLSELDYVFLEKYTSPNCTLLCAAATGIPGFIAESFGEDISEERAQVVAAAYSLVGKVSYFWGGKSNVIGWDSRWGNPATVTTPGVADTGTIRHYGLDCSGFVTWSFINGYEDQSVVADIGHGSATQWGRSVEVTEDEALPGDLVFLQTPTTSGINHVGLVVGRNDDGKLVVVHCNAGDNGVVVESAYSAGFRYIRRPLIYQDGTV